MTFVYSPLIPQYSILEPSWPICTCLTYVYSPLIPQYGILEPAWPICTCLTYVYSPLIPWCSTCLTYLYLFDLCVLTTHPTELYPGTHQTECFWSESVCLDTVSGRRDIMHTRSGTHQTSGTTWEGSGALMRCEQLGSLVCRSVTASLKQERENLINNCTA